MRLLLAILFLSTLVAPLSANAATMRYAAPSELASLSDLVVVAQVSTSETIREDNGRLVTFTSGLENLHRVREVTKGTRFVLAMWFTCSAKHEYEEKPLAP